MLVLFFHAEDGIRDTSVTGVQTCALPICISRSAAGDTAGGKLELVAGSAAASDERSEERRVGKECSSRRWPCRLISNKEWVGRYSRCSNSDCADVWHCGWYGAQKRLRQHR